MIGAIAKVRARARAGQTTPIGEANAVGHAVSPPPHQTQTQGEPRCPVIGWPPLKKAIWDQVIAANLNGGKYISAWDLTDSIYAAAKDAIAEGQDNG